MRGQTRPLSSVPLQFIVDVSDIVQSTLKLTNIIQVLRPSATSRDDLMKSCMCHRCCHAGSPTPPWDPRPYLKTHPKPQTPYPGAPTPTPTPTLDPRPPTRPRALLGLYADEAYLFGSAVANIRKSAVFNPVTKHFVFLLDSESDISVQVISSTVACDAHPVFVAPTPAQGTCVYFPAGRPNSFPVVARSSAASVS